MMRENNLYWLYGGGGIDGFGVNQTVSVGAIPTPGEGEMLCRVDAVTVCASDVKMIKMGEAYPLFADRDLASNPCICGHEASLTVVQPGAGLEDRWKPGMRVGIQPDVYRDGIRYCIGVNVPGMFQQFVLLGAEVFTSDHGSCVFPVDEDLSLASVAQLEPIACMEASFRSWSRPGMRADGSLLCLVAKDAQPGFDLDLPIAHREVMLVDPAGRFSVCTGLPVPEIARHFAGMAEAVEAGLTPDDILVIGNPEDAEVETAINRLAPEGLFCWLPEREPTGFLMADVAKVHYEKLGFHGAPDKKLSSAFAPGKIRSDYLPGGHLLLVGGAGVMGRYHLQRALLAAEGPSEVVVTARTAGRLALLARDFEEMAKQNGKILHVIAEAEQDAEEKLRERAGENGFSDVIVCAPGSEPAARGAEFLAKDGRINYFSGTSYGQLAPMPIGNVAWCGASLTAASGSNVSDQHTVLAKVESGALDPNASVAAIVGMRALRDALVAVDEHRLPGKIVLYPQLADLPLTSLHELAAMDSGLAECVEKDGWSREAERMLYRAFCIEEEI